MAQPEPDSMIGYDPLAWMAEALDETANPEPTPQPVHPTPAASALAFATPATDDRSIVLDSTLNIQSVVALHERFLQLIDRVPEIRIDASQVEQIDTAHLQLLLVLQQECVKLQKRLHIEAPSQRFVRACQLLGLDELLGIA